MSAALIDLTLVTKPGLDSLLAQTIVFVQRRRREADLRNGTTSAMAAVAGQGLRAYRLRCV
jgi:hypothetical protein